MRTIPDHAWFTSSRSSGAQNCVEVAHGPGWTAVRDSKNRTGPALTLPDRQWHAFLDDITTRSTH